MRTNGHWQTDNIGSSGFIYIEGNAIVSGSPAEVDNTPMKLTLIVDGYLEVSGNPFYTSYANPDHPMQSSNCCL